MRLFTGGFLTSAKLIWILCVRVTAFSVMYMYLYLYGVRLVQERAHLVIMWEGLFEALSHL